MIPNDEWYSSITNSELATLVHEDAVHQAGSELAVTNMRTQTNDPDLDNEGNTHEQQSTDDILNIEGNKAVVIKNAKMPMKKVTMNFKKSKKHLIVSKN